MKNRRNTKNRMSDRERWRNLCDVLAEDALHGTHPDSGQNFPRPNEQEWRKLLDWPRNEPETEPARPIGGMIPPESVSPAKEQTPPENEAVVKTGSKKPGA